MKSTAMHQEVPYKEATVETIRVLEDWYLAIGHCRQLKKQTQVDNGPWKMLTVARDGLPTVPSLHCVRDTIIRDKAKTVLRGTPEGRSFEKRQWAWHKRNNGMRQELHLRNKEPFYEAPRQIIGLEVTNRAAKFSTELQIMSVKTSWGSPPPLQSKRTDCTHL
jgi:hypothetical protein